MIRSCVRNVADVAASLVPRCTCVEWEGGIFVLN